MLVICDKMLRLQLSLARRESRLASANTLCATELPTDYMAKQLTSYELSACGVPAGADTRQRIVRYTNTTGYKR